MEFEQFYNSLPKFTKFYMISVFVVTFFTTYVKAFPLGYWLILDIDKILENFQIWRLFTNFLVVGKFSMNFLFFLMMMYNTISRMEKKAIEIKRYAEFVMLLVYTVVFVLTVSFLLHYVFGMELKPFLPFELLFALIYVEAKRDPEKMVMVWFITVKNAMVPWVLLLFSMMTGGDIVSDLVGIAAGHLYFYLKDLAPLNHALDILKTPQYLINYFDRTATTRVSPSQPTFRSVNNQNTSGSFGSTPQANQSTSATYRSTSETGTGNEFQPFQGRGHSWGN